MECGSLGAPSRCQTPQTVPGQHLGPHRKHSICRQTEGEVLNQPPWGSKTWWKRMTLHFIHLFIYFIPIIVCNFFFLSSFSSNFSSSFSFLFFSVSLIFPPLTLNCFIDLLLFCLCCSVHILIFFPLVDLLSPSPPSTLPCLPPEV